MRVDSRLNPEISNLGKQLNIGVINEFKGVFVSGYAIKTLAQNLLGGNKGQIQAVTKQLIFPEKFNVGKISAPERKQADDASQEPL